jgi:hypothetical protein
VTTLEARRFVARLLEEQRLEPRGFARQISPAAWSLPAFALGIVVGLVLFSGGDRAPDSNQSPGVEGRPALEPIAREAPIAEPDDEDPDASMSSPPRRQPGLVLREIGPRTVSTHVEPRRSSPERPTPDFTRASLRSSVTKMSARSTAVKPPQYRGSLVIYSLPPGARVSIDGRVVGVTPLALNGIRVGTRVVRVEAAGFERWSTAARVVANQQTRVTARLNGGSTQ